MVSSPSPHAPSATRKDLDPVWKALADRTRRAILDRLAKRAATTGEIVEAFPDLCRTGVMKHLGILEAAGLVIVRREGRVRWNHLNPMPIQAIHDRWVAAHVRQTTSALSRLKRHVESKTSRRRQPSKKRSKP